MSNLNERASYLKGLAEGMKLQPATDANKMILALLDLVSDMAGKLEELSDAHDELNDYVESIDDDLADLEEVLFSDDEDEELYEDDEDEDEDDEDDISYACPNCGHEIVFRASEVDFEEEFLCPECGKPVFPELQYDDEDDDE